MMMILGKNTSDRILELEYEGEKVSNTGNKNLSYGEAVITGSGHNMSIYTHLPQECVKAHEEKQIIKTNHERYHRHGRVMKRCLTGTTREIP